MARTFFSKISASKFAEQINGIVWRDKDAFNQTVYIVTWN